MQHLINAEQLAVRLWGRIRTSFDGFADLDWALLDPEMRQTIQAVLQKEVCQPIFRMVRQHKQIEDSLTRDARMSIAIQVLNGLLAKKPLQEKSGTIDPKAVDRITSHAFQIADALLVKQQIPFQMEADESEGSAWIEITKDMTPEETVSFTSYVKAHLHIDDQHKAKRGQLLVLKKTWQRVGEKPSAGNGAAQEEQTDG